MKPAMISHRARTGILWMIYLSILCLFVFGAAVNVDFVDPEVPLSQAWTSVDWKLPVFGSLPDDFRLSIVTSVICMILYGTLEHWKARVGMMVIGFLVPVFSVGIVMFPAAALSPFMVVGALLGKVDGEFYCEGLLMIAATGLWMLLCLATAIIQSVKGIGMERKSRRAAEQASLESVAISALPAQAQPTSKS